MDYSSTQRIKVLKVIIFIIPLFILLWIINQNYALTGSVTYHFRPGLTPVEGVIALDATDDLVAVADADRHLQWFLADDALRFNTRLLRGFDTVRVTVKLNNISQSHIDFFAEGNSKQGTHQTLIRDSFLDSLTWPSISNSGLTLWQRPNQNNAAQYHQIYETIDDFFAAVPNPTDIGVVGTAVSQFVRIPDYSPRTKLQTINHTIRGRHTLMMYVSGEDLTLSFNKRDLNTIRGEDGGIIIVRRGKELLYTLPIDDDGETSANGALGQGKQYNISLPDLPSGLYEVQLQASDEVLFDQISTTQRYVYFSGTLFLADGPGYVPGSSFVETIIRTDGPRVDFETPHDVGTQQQISLNDDVNDEDEVLEVEVKKKIYSNTSLEDPTTITIPKPDIFLRGSRFVFPGFDFLPAESFPVVNEDVSDKISSLHYIIAPYQPTQTFGPIIISQSYAISDLFIKDGKLLFTLNTPKLREKKAKVEIESIDVELQGKGATPAIVLQKTKDILKKIFSN